jgi:hypothetical protein
MASKSSQRVASHRLLWALVLALTLVGAGLSASEAGAAQSVRAGLLGIVPHRGQVSAFASPSNKAAAATTNFIYHGGPVMHTNKAYAIYWNPGGSAAPFPPTYTTGINRFFTDVAVDSGLRANVYSSDTQYDDTTGHVRYASTYGGTLADNAAPSLTGACVPSPCVTDQQVQDEVNHVVTVNNLPRGLGVVYFVLTPPGIASCFDSTSTTCSGNYYCAYHSGFGSSSSPTLYAAQPYPELTSCAPDDHPSSDAAADAQVNLISHEHNEAITDPLGSAWYDDSSLDENGDICAWTFGAALGGSPGARYNQLINNNVYWLQTEWSNHDSACVQRMADLKPTATFTASPNPVPAGQQVSFSVNPASVTDPDSDVTGYSWNFGDGSSGAGSNVQHQYAGGGTFTATLNVIDNDGVNPTASQVITVNAAPSGAAPPINGGSGNTGSPTTTGGPSSGGTSPPPLVVLPTLAFLSTQRSITVSRKGYFSYSFTGTPAGASGRISFGTANAIAAVRRRKLNLGSSSFTARGSGRTTVTIKLSRTNLAILKRKRSLSVKATVTIGAVTKTVIFTLKAPRG